MFHSSFEPLLCSSYGFWGKKWIKYSLSPQCSVAGDLGQSKLKLSAQRHRGESDCLGKSEGFHREDDAFDLDCQRMNQNFFRSKRWESFQRKLRRTEWVEGTQVVQYSSCLVTRMPDSPFTVVYLLCFSVVSSWVTRTTLPGARHSWWENDPSLCHLTALVWLLPTFPLPFSKQGHRALRILKRSFICMPLCHLLHYLLSRFLRARAGGHLGGVSWDSTEALLIVHSWGQGTGLCLVHSLLSIYFLAF